MQGARASINGEYLFSNKAKTKSKEIDVACCSECQSLTISRVRRPLLHKIFTKKYKFYCHDCRHSFWRNVEV